MGALVDLDVKATVEASVRHDSVEAQLGRRLRTRLTLDLTKADEMAARHATSGRRAYEIVAGRAKWRLCRWL